MPITYNDIDIEEWKAKTGVRKVSFTVYTSNNLKPIEHKANFMAEVYGEKDKEIRLLKERLGEKVEFEANEVSRYSVARDIRGIQEKVARYFYIDVKALKSVSRKKNLVVARHIAMYIARERGYSFPEIGCAFKRDHSTVINGVRKIEKDLKTDEKLKRIIEEVK